MQDQVSELEAKGNHTVFLGSAQLDKEAELNAKNPDGKASIIFVTPE